MLFRSIGGGGFLMHYDAAGGAVVAYDGRETAPAGATPGMFLSADGKPLPFREAVNSGLSVGVPGVLPMLALADTTVIVYVARLLPPSEIVAVYVPAAAPVFSASVKLPVAADIVALVDEVTLVPPRVTPETVARVHVPPETVTV